MFWKSENYEIYFVVENFEKNLKVWKISIFLKTNLKISKTKILKSEKISKFWGKSQIENQTFCFQKSKFHFFFFSLIFFVCRDFEEKYFDHSFMSKSHICYFWLSFWDFRQNMWYQLHEQIYVIKSYIMTY